MRWMWGVGGGGGGGSGGGGGGRGRGAGGGGGGGAGALAPGPRPGTLPEPAADAGSSNPVTPHPGVVKSTHFTSHLVPAAAAAAGAAQ